VLIVGALALHYVEIHRPAKISAELRIGRITPEELKKNRRRRKLVIVICGTRSF